MSVGDAAERRLREAVVDTARGMNAAGINRAKAGNVSARWQTNGFDGFLVTPTGVPYERLGPDDVVATTLEGESLAEMYWRALQVGEPVLLDDEEMERVVARFATYGQSGGS